MAVSDRRQTRWLWLTPLLLLTAGVAGTGVFGVLTYTRARDDLAHAKENLTKVEEERDAAKEQVAGAKLTAGSAVDETERLKRELAKAEKNVKSASNQIKKATTAVKATTAKADAFEAKLRSLLKKGEGDVSTKGDRVTLSLVDKVLFRSGKSELTSRGKRVIKKVGAELKKAKGKQIFVQGHTDDVPVPKSNKAFASNWELSAARALSVVHYLQDEAKISGRRLGAVAFSKYRPVDRKKKVKNRRIEIVLAPLSLQVQ